jgi:hypothetical protein
MLRIRRPGVKVLFLALPENREHIEGLREFLPMPIDPYLLVDVVGRLRGLTAHTGVASKLRAQPPRRNVGAATAARAPHPFNAASADVVVPD